MGVLHDSQNLLFNTLILLRQHLLNLKRGHTPTPRTRDRLPIPLILHITSGKHTSNARLCRSGDGQDVPIGVNLELVADEGGGGFVADGVEETGDGEVFLFAGLDVLDAEVVKEVAVTFAFKCDGVPENGLRKTKVS